MNLYCISSVKKKYAVAFIDLLIEQSASLFIIGEVISILLRTNLKISQYNSRLMSLLYLSEPKVKRPVVGRFLNSVSGFIYSFHFLV